MTVKIAIIGAGNGGQSMAAYFNIIGGYEVSIYDYFQKTVDDLNQKGEIELVGTVVGKGKIALASTNIKKIVENKDIIMVVNPAIYHNELAKKMAPYIKDEQIIFLNPSNTFGAFAFKKALEDAGCYRHVTIGESNTLLFATRLIENGKAEVMEKKDRLLVSALPACNKNKLYDIIRPVIKELQECETVLETSMDSTNSMVHPLPKIMNASWAESGGKILHYINGIGPTVGSYIEKMDEERIAIGEKLGLTLGKNLFSLFMEYEAEYNATGATLVEVFNNVKNYHVGYEPNTVKSRYIYEDVPTGLVPFVAVGELLRVPVERMKFVIKLCEMILDEDFTNRPECRSIKNLGLEGMTAKEIIQYAQSGERHTSS